MSQVTCLNNQKGSDIESRGVYNPQGVTVLNAAFIILSTFVGVGVLGLPFAFYQMGPIYAMAIVTILALTKIVTVQLYLDAMDMIPSKPRTLVAIGHDLFGNTAMYLIAGIVAFNYLSLNMCYLIVLGKTLASWNIDVFGIQ